MKSSIIFLSAEATTAAEAAAGSSGDFAAGSFLLIFIAVIAIAVIFIVLYMLFFKKKAKSINDPNENKGKIKIKNNSNVKAINKNATPTEAELTMTPKKREPFSDLDSKNKKKEKPKKEKKSMFGKPKKDKKGKETLMGPGVDNQFAENDNVLIDEKSKKQQAKKPKPVKSVKYKPLDNPTINDDKPRQLSVAFEVMDAIDSRDSIDGYHNQESNGRLSALREQRAHEEAIKNEERHKIEMYDVLSKENQELKVELEIEKQKVVDAKKEIENSKKKYTQPTVNISKPATVSLDKKELLDDEITAHNDTVECKSEFGNEEYVNHFTKVADNFGDKKILIAKDATITAKLHKTQIENVDDLAEQEPFSAGEKIVFKVAAPFKCRTSIKYAVAITDKFSSTFTLVDINSVIDKKGNHEYFEITASAKAACMLPNVEIEYGFDRSFNGRYLTVVLRLN